ncbi:MAG TPA: hypothetical protein PKD26_13130 [Pyrinomonadaceae bacterium]|nr:hypothetical protein [Pyrinomonadaceae bacterium]
MRVFLFTIYYAKLRIGAYLGTHPTHGPVDLKWRWEVWHRLRRSERKYAASRAMGHLRDDLVRLWKLIVNG